MRWVLVRTFASTPLVACAMILGQGGSAAVAQVPRPPAGASYYYPAPGTAGPSTSYASGYSYEPAPTAADPSPGYYYYPQLANAGLPAGYYYYPGPGYAKPPQGRYYYYAPPAGPSPGYTRPTPTYAVPAQQPMRRNFFGFPVPVNRSPSPGADDDYAYKS